MSNQNQMPQVQKTRFSVAITTPQYQDLIKSTLSDPARVRTFTAAITSAVAVNPALQDCQAPSIISGALLGESLNLSPSPQLGQYYLVPFENAVKGPDGKKVWEMDANGNHVLDSKGKWKARTIKTAQFVLGYRGFIQLAIRSGNYLDIDVMDVREGEYKGRDRITGKPVFEYIEDDAERDALPIVGYMAYFEYLNGFRKTLYWSKEKMLQHADTYSAAFSAVDYLRLMNGEIPQEEMWKYSSFWYKDFDSMAKKTMLRQLISKWGVMSTEMQTAYESDNCVIKRERDTFIPTQLDPPEETPDALPEQAGESQDGADQPDNVPQTQPQKIDLNNV